MHFIVFFMHSDVLHSTNRLHSNAFYNHFELLHSSDARRLHSDAFSYLLRLHVSTGAEIETALCILESVLPTCW
jgi:hypothetical protein